MEREDEHAGPGGPKEELSRQAPPSSGPPTCGESGQECRHLNFGEEMKRTEGEPWFKVSKSDISSVPWPPWNKPWQNQILSGEKWEYHWGKYRAWGFWRQYRVVMRVGSQLTWELTPSLHPHLLLWLLRMGDKASRCQNSGAQKLAFQVKTTHVHDPPLRP